MTTVLNSPAVASDWLKHEAANYFSRETGILAAGSGVCGTGMVLAKITATGKWVPAAASGNDGSQIAAGVLFDTSVDATSADKPCIVVSKHAIAAHAGLTYGSTITDAAKRAAANAQLTAAGVRVREAA